MDLSQRGTADGSAMITHGLTQVLVSVFGPREAKMRSQTLHDRAVLNVEVNIAPFSTGERRKRNRGDKRVLEFAASIKSTFEPVVQTSLYPRSQIDIHVHILQQDGGVLQASINATTLALVGAGIPLLDMVCAVTGGVHSISPMLDLTTLEENDIPHLTVAVMPKTGKVTLVTMETRLHVDRFGDIFRLACDAGRVIHQEMKRAVRARTQRLVDSLDVAHKHSNDRLVYLISAYMQLTRFPVVNGSACLAFFEPSGALRTYGPLYHMLCAVAIIRCFKSGVETTHQNFDNMPFPWTKPYDLEALYVAWTDGPVFDGKKPLLKKAKLDVGTWLDQIEAGCRERKVPADVWHKVAQHFMGKNATARLCEVEKVLTHLHGGKFRWDWKKFKMAMASICWNVDLMQSISLGRLSTNIRRVIRRKDASPKVPAIGGTKNVQSSARTTKGLPSSTEKSSQKVTDKASSSINPFASSKLITAPSTQPPSKADKAQTPKPKDPKKSEKAGKSSTSKGLIKAPLPVPPRPTDPAVDLLINAPLWLLQTCIRLEELTSEYPKTMSVLAAILITVGSIPSLPAVSAGAAGAFLASGTIHTVGYAAVGVGTWIAAQLRLQADIEESSEG
ncbi:hypothetical protein NM688_g6527 [Phlebia brevispora]|uniref:Uncharacterized protein n=1 Tax=Phlebia brevispora TaxID=194682 RepID=A0ACC1SF25_9APHY|nr:hypothetical protein NM688_g6527 [Phlebia brevispora]